ncbi:tRNA lysidine(34) synthetase TilS [Bifidobacterium aquikefiri]|uniref:tRNA lysidine(34) synthetase TilS n=2 Tax=Bifidobacterium aquikefiri TaxID=1653207 RepID=UPI0039E78B48
MYSAIMKRMIGELRKSLESQGFHRQSKIFSQHGLHAAAEDAPLILVACSGGRDSLALAYGASIVCPMLGLRCGAILINHNMQEHADIVAQHASDQCLSMGLSPVAVRSVTVRKTGAGEEADAREVRYAAIIEYAKQTEAAAVLLAHTLDDQAETVIMGLLRSAGTQAIAGMPAVSTKIDVPFLRPLLNLRRCDTTQICKDAGIEWWDDPTNGDDMDTLQRLPVEYPLRSRIRHDLMPFLDEFVGSDVAALLAGNTKQASEDAQCLDAQGKALAAASILEESHERNQETLDLDAMELEKQHVALRRRVIVIAMNRMGIPVSSRHIEAVDQLIVHWHGQGGVNLPLGFSANRQDNVIHLCKDGGHANR